MSHVTRTPLSRSKGQRGGAYCGGLPHYKLLCPRPHRAEALSDAFGQRSKVKVTRPFWLVGCTGRATWIYSNGDLSVCVHDVYRVTTCRPGRGHIVAAARLQLVSFEITCILYIIFVVLLTVKSSLHYAIETVNYTYLVT